MCLCVHVIDKGDARRVVVEEFKVELREDGREDIVYKLSTPESVERMRATPFVLTESCQYRFVISFRVNEAIVSGLRFCNHVKKTVAATRDEIVLGSYAPRSESYVFVFPRHEWMEAPSGLFYRGKYTGKFTFVDDDRVKHLEQLYTFGAFLDCAKADRSLYGGKREEKTDTCLTAE